MMNVCRGYYHLTWEVQDMEESIQTEDFAALQ